MSVKFLWENWNKFYIPKIEKQGIKFCLAVIAIM